VSQRDVESLLGRLVTDPSLRERFFEAPEEILEEELYDVSPRELTALLRIDEEEIEAFAAKIEPLSRS